MDGHRNRLAGQKIEEIVVGAGIRVLQFDAYIARQDIGTYL